MRCFTCNGRGIGIHEDKAGNRIPCPDCKGTGRAKHVVQRESTRAREGSERRVPFNIAKSYRKRGGC